MNVKFVVSFEFGMENFKVNDFLFLVKQIPTLSGYQSHMLHHKANCIKYPHVDPALSIQASNNLCESCGFVCDSPVEFSKHHEKFHKDKMTLSKLGEVTQCKECLKTFANKVRVLMT